MISQEQLSQRKLGIGSSDAAAILGLSAYKTPYDVWLEKTDRAQSEPAGDAAWIGNMLESSVLSMASERLGLAVVPAPPFLDSTFCSGVLRANVDGMVGTFDFGSPIVEAKTTGQIKNWGDSETDGLPPSVLVQVTHQMICAKSDLCYVARLGASFGLTFDIFPVKIDRSFADEIQGSLESWWREHIVKDTPPEILSGQAPSYEMLRNMRRIEGSIAEIPIELIQNERIAKEKLDESEKEYSQAKSVLLASLGSCQVGCGGGVKVTISRVERRGFDSERFKLDNPELCAQYQKISAYNKVDIRAIKTAQK